MSSSKSIGSSTLSSVRELSSSLNIDVSQAETETSENERVDESEERQIAEASTVVSVTIVIYSWLLYTILSRRIDESNGIRFTTFPVCIVTTAEKHQSNSTRFRRKNETVSVAVFFIHSTKESGKKQQKAAKQSCSVV